MGNILFIRVSAVTYSEEAMIASWPLLCDFVYSQESFSYKSLFPIEKEQLSVLNLADKFIDKVRFASIKKNEREKFLSHADQLETLRKQLDQSLSDQNISLAKSLTNKIEDALDKVELLFNTI